MPAHVDFFCDPSLSSFRFTVAGRAVKPLRTPGDLDHPPLRRGLEVLSAKLTLHARLLLSFIGVIIFSGFVWSVLGMGLMHRSLPQVQDVLAFDLSAALEIYRQHVSRITDAVRLIAQQPMVQQQIERGNIQNLSGQLQAIQHRDELDLLFLTDAQGQTLLPVRNQGHAIEVAGIATMVEQTLRERKEVASTVVLSAGQLANESPDLVERARIDVVSTSHAGSERPGNVADGLFAAAAVPVMGEDGKLLGVLCGAQLLNGRNAIADRIRSNLYREEQYDGHDVAIVSIFLGDKRIATSATTPSGRRALGTLVSEEVYKHVLLGGERWVRPGYIVDDWYLTAYQPLRDPQGAVIGAVGLGLLERKFNATERQVEEILFGVAVVAVLLAFFISYGVSNSVLKPLNSLIAATNKMAAGMSPQDIEPDPRAPIEIEELRTSFNAMTAAIRERDEQLRRQTSEKLMRSDRLAMVGQLAAGVAHEINNPLGSILLFSRLIMQQVPPEGRIRENLERIEKETKRCHAIVRNLLDFARQREPLVESLDVNQLLDATLKLFEGQFLFHNIEVVRDYNPKLPPLQADESQLQQVFMNIILNAADAMNGSGRLTLTTDDGDGHIKINISDTGCGIPLENIDRIFDPFFTTKGVGHGTGLGLSVSYGIVQNHHGDINVFSTVGSGTTFAVSLPTSQGSH
jgi:two-component system, NtrC family, sensor kinase